MIGVVLLCILWTVSCHLCCYSFIIYLQLGKQLSLWLVKWNCELSSENMISLQAWRASIGCFANNRCGVSKIIYQENHASRSVVLVPLLIFVLPPLVLYSVTLLYSIYLFTLIVIMPMYTVSGCVYHVSMNVNCSSVMVIISLMFKRYYQRVLLLSGDIELNPGPVYKTCPSCNTSTKIFGHYVGILGTP